MGGISASTPNYILYGTNGYITVNGQDVGATIGDFVIEMAPEQYYPDLAQALGPLAGTGKIIGATGKITVKMAEWNYAILSLLHHLGASSDASSETIGSGTLGTITELSAIVITGMVRNDNKAFKCTMDKGRVVSPIGATLSEKSEAGLEVVFECLYTTANPAKFPMYIQFAKA